MNTHFARIVLLFFCVSATARAEDVAPEIQAKLTFRMLTYDRALPKKAAQGGVTFAFVSKKGDADSEKGVAVLRVAFTELSLRFNLGGQSVRVIQLPFSDEKTFAADCEKEGVLVVYVGAGLGADLDALLRVTRHRGMLSIGGSRPYVQRGVSVALISDGPRATIVVNLPSVRAEASDLDSAFLRVVEVMVGPAG